MSFVSFNSYYEFDSVHNTFLRTHFCCFNYCCTLLDDELECYENEFKCDNGHCLPLSTVCNGFDDCGDNSDEVNCYSRKRRGLCIYNKKKTSLVFLALRVVDSRALSVWCCIAIYGIVLQMIYSFALTIISSSTVNKCQQFPLFTMLLCCFICCLVSTVILWPLVIVRHELSSLMCLTEL